MKKADIEPGLEYLAQRGQYGSENRVEVIAVGAHENSYSNALWHARVKLGQRERSEAIREDRDLSKNQQDAALQELEAEVKAEARKGWKKYTIDGKGSEVLCYLLDRDGNREMAWANGQKTDKPVRRLVNTREFRMTWTEHLRAEKASIERRAKQEAAFREAEAERQAQREVLVSLAEAAFEGTGHDAPYISRMGRTVEMDFERAIVLFQRAAQAQAETV